MHKINNFFLMPLNFVSVLKYNSGYLFKVFFIQKYIKIIYIFCFLKLFLTSLYQNDPNTHTKINSKQFFLKNYKTRFLLQKQMGP
jgi:hypothetical protein